MRKKFLAVMLAGSMAISMTACGSSNTKKTTAAAGSSAEVTKEEAKTTAEAKTEAETTAEETTAEASKEETTEAETTAEETTEEATTEEETTEEATTEEATTEEETTEEETTEEATTEEETTEEATTEEETTEEVTTEEETTEEVTTEEETTEEVTTEEETTEEATTEEETTEEATTEEETTEEATTEEETTEEATTEEETTEEATTEAAESEEETTEEAIDGTGFRIGMVTDIGGINDGSFNQSAWEGLQRAAEDFGCEVDYLESKVESDYVPNIDTMVDEDYDLIILVGYMMADALHDAAEMNPDQKFVIIDDSTNSDLDNVTCLMFEQAQASYLVGLVAGMTTETNNVGFVLGMSTAMMNEFGYGYLAGVLDANPDATIQQYNVNSFGDSATAKTATTNMISKGADVVFHAAGGSGLGVIDACKEKGVWAIGVDSDQSSLAPKTILTSAMKRVDNGCYDAIKETIKDELQNGVVVYDLSMGGVDIAPTTDNLSDEVLKAVEDAKQDIIDGKVVVPKTQEEFEEKYGDVYELDD